SHSNHPFDEEPTMNNKTPFLSRSHDALRAAALGSVVLLAAFLAGCGDGVAQTSGPAAAPPPPVTVAAALERDVIETQEFSGRIEAVDRAEIRPRVAGTIDVVRFTPGAEVKKGD